MSSTKDLLRERMKKRKESEMSERDMEEGGVTNSALDAFDEAAATSESSAEVVDELEEAQTLLQDMTTKRRQKQKQLSKLESPKDDVSRELRTAKKQSKQKIEESMLATQLEEEEHEVTAAVDDDGTVPMPAEDEGLVESANLETVSEDAQQKDASKKIRGKQRVKKDLSEADEVPVEEETLSAEKSSEMESQPNMRRSSQLSKFKSRIQKAKEQGEDEAKKEDHQIQRERRLKELRDRKSVSTRFDSDTGLDEAETERLAEDRARKLRQRWKKMGQVAVDKLGDVFGIKKETGTIAPEDAYDFFTQVWEAGATEEGEEPEAKAVEEKKEGEEEPKAGPSHEGDEQGEEIKSAEDADGEAEEVPSSSTKPEDEQPLLAGFTSDFDPHVVIELGKAQYQSVSERIKKEEEMMYIPSTISIPSNEKMCDGEQPRFLEEEGFYVGTRPTVALRNQNKLEHRMMQEPDKNRGWFGEDGHIISLPDPLKESPSRPPVPEDVEPYLETVFRKAVMKEFDSRYIDGALDSSGRYQLDVDVNMISFSHHHLYSREHVLATRLSQLYKQYIVRNQKDSAQFMTERLRALKTSALHLQEHLLNHKRDMSSVDKNNYERRLIDYKYEIRQTRSLRDTEEQADRSLLKNIIHTWKEMKKLRADNGFNNTSLKLTVKQEKTDKAQEELMRKQEIEDELEEVRDELEEEYNRQLTLFKQQLEEWEKQQKAKKAARKRKKRKGKGAQSDDRDDEAEAEADEQLLSEEDLPKPDPPDPVDDSGAREKIVSKAKEIRRKPGEPKLFLDLTHTASITPTSQCPRPEQQRREDISKCKTFIKILFNNKEVSRTGTKPMSQEFSVNFGQIYNLKIVRWPESIKYQVFESMGFSSTLLAEVYCGIPEASVTSDTVALEELEFSSDQRHQHNHDGVGSGVSFTFGGEAPEVCCLMTTGHLCGSVAWAVGDDGLPLVPPSTGSINSVYNAMKRLDPVAAIGVSGMVDIEKLSKWVSQSRLDPNDPANADLVYLFKAPNNGYSPLRIPEYFRLEQLQEEFNFVNDEELEANKRFKLIQYRDREINEFRNFKLLPCFEREIPRDTFTEYDKKVREAERLKRTADIESHRAAVAYFMQQVREQVVKRVRMAAHQKRLEEVVHEEAVPNIGMIGVSLMKTLEPRRPLRPERKERKRVTAQAIKGDEVKILINITRAFDIPVRRAATSGQQTSHGTESERRQGAATDILVRPFVEVMFQRNVVKTSIADGPNPSFNEELELPLKAPNDDFSSSTLQTINDNLYINLFDEVLVDILQDDRERETNVHQRIDKKWLGTFKVPFSTIYLNGKIDGTFCFSGPPVLLGYTYDVKQAAGASGDMDVDIGLGEKNQTFVNMFITIEPPLIPAEPMKEKFFTNEDEKLLKYADAWSGQFEMKYPKRELKMTVIDVSGKTVFITRYFHALKPPDDVVVDARSGELSTAEKVARFVSLIPFVSDSVVFPGICDIWNTCDNFLSMLTGDEEEHAVLLVNYFLSLGKKAWLLLGSAIPEGPTAYVLTQEAGEFLVWNASSGKHYQSSDSLCPLQSVGCLINADNIWANVQQYQQPVRMNFDVTNTSWWRPFFNKNFPSPGLASVQLDNLIYVTTDKTYVTDLQEKIEQTLKNKIMEWRNRHITRWNRYCTQSFRNLLPKLEENSSHGVSEQHLDELKHFLSNYKMSGFPMNMPFTDISAVVEAVYATGVHTQESSDVEYALAVHIHPYTNSVLSVWIYVASLIRIR